MVGYPYTEGARRLIEDEIDWMDQTGRMYLALMGDSYTQDISSVYWSEISNNELYYGELPTGDYVAGGQWLATKTPYIDTVVYHPFRYNVYTANMNETVPYSAVWHAQTFTGARGAALYQNTGDPTTSVLIAYIDLSNGGTAPQDAFNSDYYIIFGTPGSSLGIIHQDADTPSASLQCACVETAKIPKSPFNVGVFHEPISVYMDSDSTTPIDVFVTPIPVTQTGVAYYTSVITIEEELE